MYRSASTAASYRKNTSALRIDAHSSATVRRAIVANISIHHGCRAMDKYICVIAASYDEVRTLSERTGITARHITTPQQLFGLDGFRRSVIVTRTAYTMPNIDSLLREVALRGFGVVNV